MEESGSQPPQQVLIGLPVPTSVEPEPARRRRPGLRALVVEAAVGLAVLLAVLALGAPIGVLWRAVSPRVTLERVSGGWTTVEELPEGYMADDGWFLIITAVVGVLVAVLAWALLRRFRGPAVMVGVAVGSVAGAAFAAWLGHQIGLSGYQHTLDTAAVGANVARAPKILIRHAPLVQGVMAAMTYTLLAAFHYSPTLRSEPPVIEPFTSEPFTNEPFIGEPVTNEPLAGGPDSQFEAAGREGPAGLVEEAGQVAPAVRQEGAEQPPAPLPPA